MESRYITLGLFSLDDFIFECQRLNIKFVYLAKIQTDNPKKFGGNYIIPHSENWVLLTAFSFKEGLFLKLKGAFSSVDISMAKFWKDEPEEKRSPNHERWHTARTAVLNTYNIWQDKLESKGFYVGQGILSLEDKPEVMASDPT
jgi:hypothetical protein